MYADFKAHLFQHMRRDACEQVTRNFDAFLNQQANFDYTPSLAHTDFGGSNILFDDARCTVTGVIDWAGIKLCDPAIDVSAIMYMGESFEASTSNAVPLHSRPMSDPELILASASPRRRELLSRLGVDFLVRPSNVDEDPLPGETSLETQHRVTREKARAYSPITNVANVQWPIVIACDTTVLLDGEMLNKPDAAAGARRMLRALRGRAHEVQSVIVVRRGDDEQARIVTSVVVMRDYSDAEIEAYIASGDPFDKAGGYAVQHAAFRPVEEIRGCPLNVVGLSLCHLRALLPGLPDSRPVCVGYFGKPCPERLNDPAHTASGQVQAQTQAQAKR